MNLEMLKPCLVLPFFALGFSFAWELRRPNRGYLGDTLVFGLASMVFIPVLLSRWNSNFSFLLIGSSLLSLSVFFGWFLFRYRGSVSGNHGGGWRISWPVPLFILVTAFLVALTGFHISIHDETSIQSHPAMIERILHNGLPLGFMAFPDIPLKYHYGFNIFSAEISYAFNISAWMAIDVASVVLWIATLFSLVNVLNGFKLPQCYQIFAMAWILMGAGYLWISNPGAWQHGYLYGRHMKPMLVSLFFQHPVAMGLPLFFTGWDLWAEYRRIVRRVFVIAAIFLTAVLSLAQIILFGGLIFAIGMDIIWILFWSRFKNFRILTMGVIFLILSLGLAYFLGGFFESGNAYQGGLMRVVWPPGFLRNEYFGGGKPITWVQGLFWYLLNFGAPLALFPFAVIVAIKKRAVSLFPWFAMAGLGLLVPQFLQYQLSWDVMKFFMLFDIASRLIIAILFLPWLQNSIWRWLVAGIILASSMVDPTHFLFKLGLTSYSNLPVGVQALIGLPHQKNQSYYRDLIEIWKVGSAKDFVLADRDLSKWIALYSGQAVLEYDQNTVMEGVSQELLRGRQVLIQSLWKNLSSGKLVENKVRWVVWSCQNFEKLSLSQRESLDFEIATGAFQLTSLGGAGKPCLRILRVLR